MEVIFFNHDGDSVSSRKGNRQIPQLQRLAYTLDIFNISSCVDPKGGGGQPRGGGTLFFSAYVGLDPASTVHPKKISGISSTQKKIFEILATPKNIPILYLDLKKRP